MMLKQNPENQSKCKKSSKISETQSTSNKVDKSKKKKHLNFSFKSNIFLSYVSM